MDVDRCAVEYNAVHPLINVPVGIFDAEHFNTGRTRVPPVHARASVAGACSVRARLTCAARIYRLDILRLVVHHAEHVINDELLDIHALITFILVIRASISPAPSAETRARDIDEAVISASAEYL